jgi:hypothetical protein
MKKKSRKMKKRFVNEVSTDYAGLQPRKITMTNNTRCRMVVKFSSQPLKN